MPSESWILDSLPLSSGAFDLLEVTADPPAQRADWITAADSESAALFRQPLHENRTITAKLKVRPQASMDVALNQVGAIVDKLRKASSTTTGIGLVWTPNDSTRSCTFTVLAGEITGMPIATTDEGYLWVLRQPIVAISLTCQPYAAGVETVTGTSSSSTPFDAFEVTGVTGDIPALGRLIITDTATQSRRHVEWGIEGPLTYNNATSLLVDSDDMVTTGFLGTQSTATGAYDPNALGNNVVQAVVTGSTLAAVCGTGNLSHVGVFRVKARVQSDAAGAPGSDPTGSLINQQWRLSWKAGDGPLVANAWVSVTGAGKWRELDLGTITVPTALAGTQRWTGRIDIIPDKNFGGNVWVDYLILVPQADGYGKSRAVWANSIGLPGAWDAFRSTTAGSALNTRTAPLGGAWATSGDTTDFVFADNFLGTDTVESISRSTAVSETVGRWAILGSASYTDVQVDVRAAFSAAPAVNVEQTAIARWTDASNHLRFSVTYTPSGAFWTARIEQVVAATVTLLASSSWTGPGATEYRLRLLAFSTGRVIGQVFTDGGALSQQVEASSTTLATGGTLATGKPGLRDRSTAATAVTRTFTEFAVSTPPTEPIVLYSGKSMQVRYDDTIRQDSTGTYYGRPPAYRGSRFLVPVGTSRVLVKARRNDIEAAADDQVTDALQAQVGWTPRYLAVPR